MITGPHSNFHDSWDNQIYTHHSAYPLRIKKWQNSASDDALQAVLSQQDLLSPLKPLAVLKGLFFFFHLEVLHLSVVGVHDLTYSPLTIIDRSLISNGYSDNGWKTID